MGSPHRLAWLSPCLCLGGLVFIRAALRLHAHVSPRLVASDLFGGIASAVASPAGDGLTRIGVDHIPGTLAFHWLPIEWAAGFARRA